MVAVRRRPGRTLEHAALPASSLRSARLGPVGRPSTIERLLPWFLRLIWVAVLVAGGPAIEGATESDTAAAGDVLTWVAFGGWTMGVIAMAIPAVTSLTAVRLIVPVSVPVSVVALGGGADTGPGVAFVAASVLASFAAFSADLGRTFVQASAYGEEDRHLLRPPAAYALASIVSWVIWAGLVIGAPLLLAGERWILGCSAAAGALAGAILGWPRWHRLSRRWFVVVPIGVVIHDELVLAQTVMLRRGELAGLRLAPAGTEAADLSGPASGHAVEITTNEPTTAVFAATPKTPGGTAIHLRACLVAPSRPGQALHAAAARRLPVG